MQCLEGLRETKNGNISHRAVCKKKERSSEEVVGNNRVNLEKGKVGMKMRALFLITEFLQLGILQTILLSFL